MFSRQQQMFPQTATKVPQGNRWVGSTNGWSDGSNGWYWPTHPCSIILRIFFPFANPKPDKNPMLSCSKKIWFKSNQFSSQFFGKTTDLYNFNEFPNKNFLWVLCLENPPYFFATPPPFLQQKPKIKSKSAKVLRNWSVLGLFNAMAIRWRRSRAAMTSGFSRAVSWGTEPEKRTKPRGPENSRTFSKWTLGLRTLSYISDSIFVETHQ